MYKGKMTLKEAAEALGLKVSYIRKLVEQGKIGYYKPFGKMIYVRESDLDKLFKDRIPSVEELLTNKGL